MPIVSTPPSKYLVLYFKQEHVLRSTAFVLYDHPGSAHEFGNVVLRPGINVRGIEVELAARLLHFAADFARPQVAGVTVVREGAA